MSEYDNRGRFVLFRNENKREGKKDADYKGTFTDMDGVEYFADAWINTGKNGAKYMSGKTKRKDKQPDTAYNAALHGDSSQVSARDMEKIVAAKPGVDPEFNDDLDIPF